MVFLYLCTALPSVALLELELLNKRTIAGNSSTANASCDKPADDLDKLAELTLSNWVKGLEQIMLLILVIGRWLMPKGEMTRDQLSQLLLVYIGLGADIIEILEVFTEPEVETNMNITVTGLALFSWALMQFTLVLTQLDSPPPPSAPSRSVASFEDSESPAIDLEAKRRCRGSCSCCINEVWSLVITVGMQDGPFLIFRLYLMIHKHVLNQMMIFFAVKNVLTVLIEIYRIVVVQFKISH
ncbi:transmembrane protein 26-like [Ambystoma mexicanum]|uniref:transmembrane protein 26-like n=1 Tax=Ambystoma mexicanum TaxID=8296 RepID=UPI0037E9AFD0